MKKVMVYINRSSFIKSDIDILKCSEYKFTPSIKGFIKQFFYFLTHRYDQYYIFFCDLHGLIPVLFSRLHGKSTILVGGYDAVRIDDYGIFDGGVKSKIIKLIYKLAHDVIISSGDELKERLNRHIKTDAEVIYPGIDTSFFTPAKGIKRDIDYITTAGATNEKIFYRKGLNRFINMAESNPDKKFVIINCSILININNIEVTGRVSDLELKKYYNRSKYYCQLSRYESFGISLIEAMSMGCMPIVSDVGMMKIIAGNVTTREEARNRAVNNYSLKIRINKLNNYEKNSD